MTGPSTVEPEAKRDHISFIFRGTRVDVSGFAPHATLLDWLRLNAHATGTKEGCGEGDCGACTVVLARREPDGTLDQRPVNACILLLGQVDGSEVLTIEDLADGASLHPVQQAMVDRHGSQCGFCTPGIVMSLFALYQAPARPVTRAAIEQALAGNLCRCTGYRPIVDAALDACAAPAADRFATDGAARAASLEPLDAQGDLFAGTQDSFFAAPASEDALAELYLAHPDALLLSGATDVGLWITKGLQAPRKIVWLGRLRGFDAVTQDADTLSLGAGLSLADSMPLLAAIHPDLGEIMRRFGSAQVRASGTVGGSLANASPIGDLAPCLIALGASIELRRGNDTRVLPLENYFIAYRKQDRQPGEYLRRVVIPSLPAASAFRAFKVSKRFDEDISAVLGAFHLTLAGRRVTATRIAYGGMAGTPARAPKAEFEACAIDLDAPASWEPALAALDQDYTPLSDMRASAAYRSRVARNLFLKTLMELSGMPADSTRILMPDVSHAAE